MKQIKGLFEEIRGSTKHNTFKTYTDKRKLVIMTKRPIPSYTRTEEQDQQRTLFKNAITAWKNLSEEEKQEYAEQARPYALTGYQYFIKQYLLTPPPAEIWYKVTIDNTASSSDLTDYQIRIDISNDAQFFTDAENKREAIRLYDSDKTTPLSYWIEEWDTTNHNARIWVKVPSIPAGGVTYLYISIDTTRTEDASSGEETFLFFDDFEDGIIDTEKWQTYDGCTESGGKLTIGSETKTAYTLLSKNTFAYPKRLRYRGRFVGTGYFQSLGLRTDEAPRDGVSIYRDSEGIYFMTENEGEQQKTPISIDTDTHTWEIDWESAQGTLYEDDTQKATNTENMPDENLYVRFATYEDTGDCTLEIEWIFVSKYAPTEPTISYAKE